MGIAEQGERILMDLAKKKATELLADQTKTTPDKPTPGGLFGKIMEMVTGKNPEAAAEAEKAKGEAQTERASLWKEVGKSLFLRQFPRLAAITDLRNAATGNQGPETVPWQHEFEAISAFLILIPNDWKHYITDFFAENEIFRTMVEHWPGLDGIDAPIIGSTGLMSKDLPGIGKGGSLRKRILEDKDPDAVIEVLRIMHQDFVTGKVALEKLKDQFSNLPSLNQVALSALGLTGGLAGPTPALAH